MLLRRVEGWSACLVFCKLFQFNNKVFVPFAFQLFEHWICFVFQKDHSRSCELPFFNLFANLLTWKQKVILQKIWTFSACLEQTGPNWIVIYRKQNKKNLLFNLLSLRLTILIWSQNPLTPTKFIFFYYYCFKTTFSIKFEKTGFFFSFDVIFILRLVNCWYIFIAVRNKNESKIK